MLFSRKTVGTGIVKMRSGIHNGKIKNGGGVIYVKIYYSRLGNRQ